MELSNYWNFTRNILLYFLTVILLPGCATLEKRKTQEEETFQTRMNAGWEHVNKRQPSKALIEFNEASTILPDRPEPYHGQAIALFKMDSMNETLEACAALSSKHPDYFDSLGFCWGARLEAERASAEVKEEVRREIEMHLSHENPSLELLYNAYNGYYYLKDQDMRFILIMRLAKEGAESVLSDEIAGSLFNEIIESAQSGYRIKLAESYIQHFPRGRMADRAALIVLNNLFSKQQGTPDHVQLIQTVLAHDEDSYMINGAAAQWLIENNSALELAAQLLNKSLTGLNAILTEVPKLFSEKLWNKMLQEKRMHYQQLLGRALLGSQNFTEARNLFEEVMFLQPNWPDPYHFMGLIAEKNGEPEDAVRFFKNALVKGGNRPETVERLKVLLANQYGFTGEPLDYFQAVEPGVRFRDVTIAAGLEGVSAGRVAWGDYNCDGNPDLLLDGSQLFINQGNGGFTAAPAGTIPGEIVGATGGIWGDYDNDGFLDIFMTSRTENFLLHNENGTFFTVAQNWPKTNKHSFAPEAAAWGDLNNDGYTDLYLANYEYGAVMRGRCSQDQLFLNRGVSAGLEDSSAAAGILSEEAMCGRGVTWADLNSDGWQDILVTNYRLDPNFLWLNRGEGSLVDVAESTGVQGNEVAGAYGHSIGGATGDLDGDGDPDMYISNLAHPRYLEFSDLSMVLINNSGTLTEFSNGFDNSGISFDETSSDPLLFDADLDGDLDLYVTSIYRGRVSHLYLNDNTGKFSDRTWLAGAGVENGWGVASADYDHDGYPDLLVASREGVHLLHNEGGENNWLSVRLVDLQCNRFGLGSKITVRFEKQSIVREIVAGRGTGSQDSLTASFGLGKFNGVVSIEVKTLCGDIIEYTTSDLNRLLTLTITEAQPLAPLHQ